MMINIAQSHSDLLQLTIAVSVSSFGFLIYHLLSESGRVRRLLKSDRGGSKLVFFQRATGVLIFGMLPLVYLLFTGHPDFASVGVKLPGQQTFIWTLILSILIVPMNYFNSSNKSNLEMYPQVRHSEWSLRLLVLSAFSWMAYLLAYEFLFRGFFLFPAIAVLGLWPAIVLNTAVYSLVHLPKGTKESVGAIPLGFILCYLTYRTGTIWVAVFTHFVMALTNEWFSLRAHPQMMLKKNRK